MTNTGVKSMRHKKHDSQIICCTVILNTLIFVVKIYLYNVLTLKTYALEADTMFTDTAVKTSRKRRSVKQSILREILNFP